jgi:hypothetical protein
MCVCVGAGAVLVLALALAPLLRLPVTQPEASPCRKEVTRREVLSTRKRRSGRVRKCRCSCGLDGGMESDDELAASAASTADPGSAAVAIQAAFRGQQSRRAVAEDPKLEQRRRAEAASAAAAKAHRAAAADVRATLLTLASQQAELVKSHEVRPYVCVCVHLCGCVCGGGWVRGLPRGGGEGPTSNPHAGHCELPGACPIGQRAPPCTHSHSAVRAVNMEQQGMRRSPTCLSCVSAWFHPPSYAPRTSCGWAVGSWRRP